MTENPTSWPVLQLDETERHTLGTRLRSYGSSILASSEGYEYAAAEPFITLGDEVERTGRLDLTNESNRETVVDVVREWNRSVAYLPPEGMGRVVDAVAHPLDLNPNAPRDTPWPILQLDETERHAVAEHVRDFADTRMQWLDERYTDAIENPPRGERKQKIAELIVEREVNLQHAASCYTLADNIERTGRLDLTEEPARKDIIEIVEDAHWLRTREAVPPENLRRVAEAMDGPLLPKPAEATKALPEQRNAWHAKVAQATKTTTPQKTDKQTSWPVLQLNEPERHELGLVLFEYDSKLRPQGATWSDDSPASLAIELERTGNLDLTNERTREHVTGAMQMRGWICNQTYLPPEGMKRVIDAVANVHDLDPLTTIRNEEWPTLQLDETERHEVAEHVRDFADRMQLKEEQWSTPNPALDQTEKAELTYKRTANFDHAASCYTLADNIEHTGRLDLLNIPARKDMMQIIKDGQWLPIRSDIPPKHLQRVAAAVNTPAIPKPAEATKTPHLTGPQRTAWRAKIARVTGPKTTTPVQAQRSTLKQISQRAPNALHAHQHDPYHAPTHTPPGRGISR